MTVFFSYQYTRDRCWDEFKTGVCKNSDCKWVHLCFHGAAAIEGVTYGALTKFALPFTLWTSKETSARAGVRKAVAREAAALGAAWTEARAALVAQYTLWYDTYASSVQSSMHTARDLQEILLGYPTGVPLGGDALEQTVKDAR